VQFGPIENQLLCSPGKNALKNLERLNVDRGFKLPVLGMEMGRSMFIEKHPNEDAIECTDYGHIQVK
jgi:hypothetical protein